LGPRFEPRTSGACYVYDNDFLVVNIKHIQKEKSLVELGVESRIILEGVLEM
jgi:hypothetical protein